MIRRMKYEFQGLQQLAIVVKFWAVSQNLPEEPWAKTNPVVIVCVSRYESGAFLIRCGVLATRPYLSIVPALFQSQRVKYAEKVKVQFSLCAP
jgi:hypothetical protein